MKRDGVTLLRELLVGDDPEMERLLAEVRAEGDRIQAEYDRTGVDPYEPCPPAPYDFSADGSEDTAE